MKEIVIMINNACNGAFSGGVQGCKDVIIRCATQIYIAQMNTEKEDAE